jgi:asparagine synthase (glutamine-hydrolysing)
MNIAPLIVVCRGSGRTQSPWLDSALAKLNSSGKLTSIFKADGIDAIGDAHAPHFVLPDSGLIWGVLFDRMTSGRIVDAGEPQLATDEIERFVERRWGGYIAVRRLGEGIEIFRDSSGAIPCYHAQVDGIDFFTTRPEMMVDTGLIEPEIDWTILTQALVYRSLRPARTALRGISELMPGTAATLSDGALRIRTAWSPWRFTTPEAEVETASEAADRVRRIATSCIGAWGRCFERPLIEISGGLDSSIVAAVLAGTNPGAACITFAAARGDPDETPYARAVAEHLGFELQVLRAEVSDVALTRSHARDLPRPCARGFAQAHEAQLRAVAACEQVDSFFSGGGGDNVLGYLKSVLPVLDRWRRGGGGLFGTIGDVAALAEVSIWEVVAKSVRRALRPGGGRRWLLDTRFLAPPAIRDLPFPQDHPWTQPPRGVLPGKLVHGRALIVIQNHLEGLDRLHDAPIISPLLSQPLVETCMAIPTWLWCDGGINRAVARKAFADSLPATIIDRRSKGAFDTYCAQVFAANRTPIREMLLDGALGRQGLLDLEAIEARLANDTVGREDMLRLLDLVDVEAWIGAWSSRPNSTSAT